MLIMTPALLSLAAALPQTIAKEPMMRSTEHAVPGHKSIEPAAVVAEIRRIIGETYVLPERRSQLDAALTEGLRSGRYDVRRPALFAERVNWDLTRVGHDHHLNFKYDPAAVAAAARRGTGEREDLSLVERRVREGNHGVRELRVLPGNVRYLDLASFEWIGEESETTLNAAMTFLSSGDAVIIDLRRNGGGNGRAVQQIISHFVEAGRPLITFYSGGGASPTIRSLPGLSSMIGKPLFVLTSGGTGSAAEELVGHVAGYKLGEVVGARTSGGAFMNEVFPIDGRFELSVSVARPVLAATGKDWEGTGIQPTIVAPVETALETAHLHALQKLAATAEPSRRATLEGLVEGLDAMGHPYTPDAPLNAYVGTFGNRHVFLQDGKLWYRLEERPRRLMVPLGGHRFTVADDPSLRINFALAGGRAAALDLGLAGEAVQGTYERTQ